MKYYAHYGHKEFILCLGYRGDMIKDFFKNYLWNTCDVTLTLGKAPTRRIAARKKAYEAQVSRMWGKPAKAKAKGA